LTGRKNNGFVYRTVVRADDAGCLVWQMLARRYAHSSSDVWQQRVQRGEVRRGGRVLTLKDEVFAGEVVHWHRPPWVEPDVPRDVRVVHADAHLLVVDKPAGLPVMPSGGFLENTLWSLLKPRWGDVAPMHRLGTGTSGLVAFGRTAEARRLVQAAWRGGQVRKVYAAVVCGGMVDQTVRMPIGPVPHALLGTVHAASAAGRASTSHFTAIEPRDGETLVHVLIETGRPHQIRIHAAVAGHPLVGDPLYVAGGAPRQDVLPSAVGYRLHARELTLPHPERSEGWRGVLPAPWEAPS
jgi:23S rRNA pseudouridine1911/1915/1917 synthase